MLHHGTLLFDSHLEALKGALKVDLSKFEDKAVQSNRSEVTNISNYLPSPISVMEFTDFLFCEISQNYPEFKIYEPTPEDIEAIQKLAIEKYQTWDWIFGYSPRYRFTNSLDTANGEIFISLLVEKGHIAEASISGAIQAEISQNIGNALLGCRHDFESVKTSLFGLNEEFQKNGLTVEELMNGLF